MEKIKVVQALKNGELVAFPTDTVYGLAALASSRCGIDKIYQIKHREQHKPLIAMVPLGFDITELVEIPEMHREQVERLIATYWPGELTLIFKMKKNPYIVLEYETLGIRIPNHEQALAVLEACGEPLFVTSANRSGEPSATCVEEVYEQLGSDISVVISGNCGSGVASTIVSYVHGEKEVLRQGNINIE